MSEQMPQLIHRDEPASLNFISTLQEIATRRSFKPYAKGEPIIYEFTDDPALLHQYYLLRELRYLKLFKVDVPQKGEDFHDKLGQILIARRGKLCLGGCRLSIREGDEQWQLPTETSGFEFRELFPDLKLDKLRHAEISRFVVMEDTGDDVLFGLCKAMYDKVTNSGIHYLFVSSTYTMARNWRLVSNRFGVKTTKIFDSNPVADDILGDDVKWYLTLSDLTSFCQEGSSVKNSAKIAYIEN